MFSITEEDEFVSDI